ncbi:MAG: glucose 1-dehydrogenase [Chloroflexi bacterium]|nr:glucose 1-dehydrogenase [Chloroflexota bacterium]
MTILDQFDLKGQVAIVTGGGTGLGHAMAQHLARAGADIVLAGRRKEPIEAAARELQALGRRTRAVVADVARSADVNRLVQEATSTFGKVDILVNNAGGGPGTNKQMWEITDEEWHQWIDVNLTGTFYCTRAVIKQMAERRRGKIINIASGHGYRGGPGAYQYGSAKAGVINLTRVMAMTYGREGVNTNCIAPGYFPTPEREQTPATRGAMDNRWRFVPMGRGGTMDEIGALALFLASPASDYVNGELFLIDGGGLAGGFGPWGYVPAVAPKAVS